MTKDKEKNTSAVLSRWRHTNEVCCGFTLQLMRMRKYGCAPSIMKLLQGVGLLLKQRTWQVQVIPHHHLGKDLELKVPSFLELGNSRTSHQKGTVRDKILTKLSMLYI